MPCEQEPGDVPHSDHSLPFLPEPKPPRILSSEEEAAVRVRSEAFLKIPAVRFEVEERRIAEEEMNESG
ncbi:hypothetical protein EXS54_02170 [Patescibacteria group bacterium]|nr:hypothetical protein [Patescibacteria group bacterium]